MIAELKPKPTPPQAKAFRAMANEPTAMLFVSQHDFFCYVITTVGYTDVTPGSGQPEPAGDDRRAARVELRCGIRCAIRPSMPAAERSTR